MPPEAKNFISRIIQDVGEYTLKVAQFSLSAIFFFASTVVELIVVPFITFYMMKRGAISCMSSSVSFLTVSIIISRRSSRRSTSC